MNRLERVACLYLTFRSASRPYSFAELRRLMPGAWSENLDSARRTFERDKEELKKLGLVLEHIPSGGLLPNGRIADEHVYWSKGSRFKLPEISWSERERKELAEILKDFLADTGAQACMSAQEVELLKSASEKILYQSPTLLDDFRFSSSSFGVGASVAKSSQAPNEEDSKDPDKEKNDSPSLFSLIATANDEQAKRILGVLHSAMQQKRKVEIEYKNNRGVKSVRTVIPRGLVARGLRWCLVGFCETAREIRSFYVDQCLSAKLLEENFRPDPGFRVEDYNLHPLSIGIHEVREIRLIYDLRFEEDLRALLLGLPPRLPYRFRESGPQPGDKSRGDEIQTGVLELSTSNQEALFSWMIRHPRAIRSIEPASARDAYRAWFDSTLSLYSPESVPEPQS